MKILPAGFVTGLLKAYLFLAGLGILSACAGVATDTPSPTPLPPRQTAIPEAAVKISPQTDIYPPILHSQEWEAPLPLPGGVNTRGAEDAPFVSPDGSTLYFFFTPDVLIPPEFQAGDGFSGIYRSRRLDGEWVQVERVLLADPGQTALDGCPTLQGDTLWFCSARLGFTGVQHFTARLVEDAWQDWEYAGEQFAVDDQVGELHITQDGSELYFHSHRGGGQGGLDIWVTRKVGDSWSAPENVAAVNGEDDDGWPFITPDGEELWFTRTRLGAPAIFRSRRSASGWTEPELVVSQFAGEPTLDIDGNLFFVHHYFLEGRMVEADIYVAYHR